MLSPEVHEPRRQVSRKVRGIESRRIGRRPRRIVGILQPAALWVENSRQIVVVVGLGPQTGSGVSRSQVSLPEFEIALWLDRHPSIEEIKDVPVGVGIENIEHRNLQAPEGRFELG